MLTLEHIDPRTSDHICGLENEFNEVIADSAYNNRKNNRFVPYRICDHPAPTTFGDTAEFLIEGEWKICEFGGEEWWNESTRIGCHSSKWGFYPRTEKHRAALAEISKKFRDDPRVVAGRLRGAKTPASEKQKEAARQTGRRNKGKTFSLSDKAKERRATGGRKGAQILHSQKWECLVTGKVTTAGALTHYQKARGIDPSQRRRIL